MDHVIGKETIEDSFVPEREEAEENELVKKTIFPLFEDNIEFVGTKKAMEHALKEGIKEATTNLSFLDVKQCWEGEIVMFPQNYAKKMK